MLIGSGDKNPEEEASPSPLKNTEQPSVSVIGLTAYCEVGTWTGNPPPTLSYRWQRDATDIPGAVSAPYIIQPTDAEHAISCRVTATNPFELAEASSPSKIIHKEYIEENEHSGTKPGGTGGAGRRGSTSPPVVKCTVPKLKGKTLAKTKKLLTQNHCALGKVKKVGKKPKKVTKQRPKSGTLPSGSKVSITLG
jgi:hypothetical protein